MDKKLEYRITRLEKYIKRIINEKKVYTSDTGRAYDLLNKLLDDKSANKDNITIKDLDPKEIDHPQYGTVIRVNRCNLNLAAPQFRNAIDKWMRNNSGYKWAFWWAGKDHELMDVVVYTVAEENFNKRKYTKRFKNENYSFNEAQRISLENMLEQMLNSNEELYEIDVNDENGIYGYLNVCVSSPDFEVVYDVVFNNDKRFEVEDDGTKIYECDSLNKVAKFLAEEVWLAEDDLN